MNSYNRKLINVFKFLSFKLNHQIKQKNRGKDKILDRKYAQQQ